MSEPNKPDLKNGILASSLPDGGKLLGVVGEEEVLLVRQGTEVLAVGAHCTHYQGPLAEGLIVGDQVRCPLHHACFSLRSGEALRAPALDPIQCWRVEQIGDRIFVKEKRTSTVPKKFSPDEHPTSIVVIGGGAAGFAAAEMLRREGYEGSLTIVSADDSPPCDRPNLSKDYLAGTAPEDWIPLRPPDWYAEKKVELLLNTRVSSLDTKQKKISTNDGKTLDYGALLLAMGAEPIRLPVPGADPSRVLYLRSFADSKAIVSKATVAKQVVVVGASFIGLEVAASLRTRGVSVHVVAPEQVPMAKILGEKLGNFVRRLHESHGVVFHMGETVREVKENKIALSGGQTIDADFLVLGVGVKPVTALAEKAGLTMDRGISVNEYLETSAPGVFAAGDAARWPDPHSGERIRVEHWVVAERQGQTAAKNMLGARVRFELVPFFWSQHYDVPINYVGHAEKWDSIDFKGDLDKNDCVVSYKRDGRTIAVATVFRDLESLNAELMMEIQTENLRSREIA